MANDRGIFGGIGDAFGIIRQELPRWWVEANTGRYVRPGKIGIMAPPGAPIAAPEYSSDDAITLRDVAGAVLPTTVSDAALMAALGPTSGAVRAGLLGLSGASYAEDAEGKGGTAKAAAKVAKKVKKAIGTIWDNVDDADAAMALAKKGFHLKRMPDGTYVGAPAQVTSPQSLSKVRKEADRLVDFGLFNAPWYDRARDTYRMAAPGDDAAQSLFARGGAAYSPQATPPVETGAFLSQHNNKVVLDNNVVPRTRAQARNVAKAYSWDDATGESVFNPEAIRLGKKTNPYADAKDPTVPEASQYRTANDIWHARVMGYQGPIGASGKPTLFSRGLTPQEHGYLTGENLLLADRAAIRNAGNPILDQLPAGFTPRSAQAATWGAKRYEDILAKDLYRWQRQFDDFASGASNKEPERLLTDRELKKLASIGIDDAVRPHVASLTREAINDPMLEGKSWAEKLAYSRAAFGDGRDPTIKALGMYQMPPKEGVGYWVDPDGVMHTNPMVSARPLVSFERTKRTTSGGKTVTEGAYVDPASMYALDAASYIDAVMRGQGAGAANVFVPASSSMRPAEMSGGKLVAPPNIRKAIKDRLDSMGLLAIDTGEALMIGQYGDTPMQQMFKRTVRVDTPSTKRGIFGMPKGEDLQKVIGGVLKDFENNGAAFQYTPGRLQSIYNPIDWSGPEGTVTRGLLGKIGTSPIHNFEQRLDRSGWVGESGMLAALNRLDSLMNTAEGIPLKPQLMKLREIISKDGFSGLRRYVEKNGTAGLPAVGLAFPGLFDDEPRRGMMGTSR